MYMQMNNSYDNSKVMDHVYTLINCRGVTFFKQRLPQISIILCLCPAIAHTVMPTECNVTEEGECGKLGHQEIYCVAIRETPEFTDQNDVSAKRNMKNIAR